MKTIRVTAGIGSRRIPPPGSTESASFAASTPDPKPAARTATMECKFEITVKEGKSDVQNPEAR